MKRELQNEKRKMKIANWLAFISLITPIYVFSGGAFC
jgi:hypothetical protein